MTGPLTGLRVLSLAEQYPGPYATLLLADLGADVVLVERPGLGDPSRQFGPFFESLARGKRSVALDLKDPEGIAALLALCSQSDVLLEGYRPGTMQRLGAGYEQVSEVNPRLVYASISGFGQDGPYRDRPAHDVSYQAVAGHLHERLESPGRSPAPSLALGDLSAGLFAVVGVLAGLQQRERTGRGTHVDVSMTDGLVSLLTAHLVPVVNRLGPPAFPYEPGYGVFATADGQLLALSVAHEDHFWRQLCAACELDDLVELRSAERLERYDEFVERIAETVAARDRPDWQQRLADHEVPHAWVNDLDGVAQDPQVRARGMFVTVPADQDHPARVHVRQPLRFDGDAPAPHSHAPGVGAQTREVLLAAGCPSEVVDRLVARAST